MSKKMRGNLLLLLAALIWGSTFVAQSEGTEYVQGFTYNASRSFIGFAVLLPVVWFFSRNGDINKRSFKTMLPDAVTLKGGICCGIVLSVASAFQQYGIAMTTAGKAGFITALYIVFVPIAGIFIGKKIPKVLWLCVGMAIAGFYLLCVKEGFSVSTGDALVLCCAFCFTAHILVIDHFNALSADGIKMSCLQFLTTGVVSLILMLLFEKPVWTDIWAARTAILYAGVLSSGVAYTLQIVAQKDTDPTTATLIMSLESVFAALSGWLILHEHFSLKEFIGCCLVFAAVILAQLPEKNTVQE